MRRRTTSRRRVELPQLRGPGCPNEVPETTPWVRPPETSVDGYVLGAGDGPEYGLGRGAEHLHYW